MRVGQGGVQALLPLASKQGHVRRRRRQGGATASPGAAGRRARHEVHMQERAWGRLALNGKHSGRLAAESWPRTVSRRRPPDAS